MKTHGNSKEIQKNFGAMAACLILVMMAAGCASTEVVDRTLIGSEQLPRPATIWVCDFTATAAELPAESVLASERNLDTTPQTAEQIATGRQLGAAIAAQLIEEIRAMGLVAARGVPGTKTQVNDLLLRGYLLSIKEGDATKRVVVGLGSGASELRTLVEGFQVTATEFRKLGSGSVNAGGSKSPGAAVGVATFLATANPAGLIISSGMKVYGEASGSSKLQGRAKATAKEIAGILKQRFQQQGWIN